MFLREDRSKKATGGKVEGSHSLEAAGKRAAFARGPAGGVTQEVK
jgi:hypothetical protein